MGIERTDAVVGSFLFECFQTKFPDFFRALGRSLQEGCVSSVRRDVFTNEITDIDFFAPKPVNKGFVLFHNIHFVSG